MEFLILMIVIAVVVGIASAFWRANMAMNHPEKYERFRQMELDQHAKQKEVLGTMGKGAFMGASLAYKLLKR